MRKLLLTLVSLAVPCLAQHWTLEKLFARPYVWGTSPQRLAWSKQGHTLLFLWNAQGGRFLDLYAYHPDTAKLVRLTDLEPLKDELNLPSEEKDERQKQYLPPQAGLSAFDVSRDGTKAAFSYRGDLWVAATSGATPPFRLTRTKTAEAAPRFSPDGTQLAYTLGGQILVQDLARGSRWQATDIEAPAALTGYRWAPDGRSFVYSVRKGTARQIPLPNYSGRFVTAQPFPRAVAGDEPAETALYVVPVEGGKPLELQTGDWGAKVYADLPVWSPDSTKLLTTIGHPKFKKSRVVVIDAATGKPAVVHEETDEKWVNRGMASAWSPDSRTVLYTSERDGWSHLYTVPAAGGAARQLTSGPWEIHTETFSLDPQWVGEYIYFASTEEGPSERHFYRIRPDGSGKQKLSAREGLNIGLVSEDGRHTAWLLADLKNPFDLWVDGRRVTVSPRPEFARLEWPETRFVRFPSPRDGKMVAAKMLLPPGYKPGERSGKTWPAVVFIHGSGYATSVLKQWGSYQEVRFAYNCYLARKGYVVFDLDYRGSSGYGRDWRTDVYLHLGGPDLDDVLGGVEYLRGLGNIDMKRIGIWGVSYGGFMTNMAMFRSPDTFRAGVSWAAVNDWENYNSFYTGERLTTPKENPDAYKRSSPIHFSGGLKNPLLIVHGMVDNNVLFQDAVQLTEKLIHEGKRFSHIYYPEESHGFVRDETWIDAFRRTTEWFDEHLR